MTEFILLVYGVASTACFIMYALDKQAARAGRRRISERSLLLAGLACGWPGAWLAQRWLRHKSSKTAFLWRFRITVLLNAAAVAAIVYTSSHVALS